MDNAVVHRFVLNQKGDVEIMDERFSLRPTSDFTAHYQTASSFNTSYEEPYQHKSLSDWQQDDKMATAPLLLSAPDDTSWIKPGQFSWEWWNGATPYGPDVDFKAGCNYETYCYFADFAAKYGIEYILLDEGWAKSTTDPFNGNDELRLPELIKYCDAKGMKIVLWLPWLAVYNNFDTIFKTYADWGITAVKIDFMDHADQWMVNFYKRVTAEAAKYHIIIDWHGAFTPAGLEQEYPNLLSYEGVLGLEQMARCTTDNNLFIPFIRNAVGPADFTPGGMYNMQPERYRATRPNSGAMGTRAFQMAL